MEDEEGKVEVDELYLGFCLIHVLYKILPCGFKKLLGVYKVGKLKIKTNKMIVMDVEHVIVFSNLSHIMNKIWLSPLFSLIITTMYIKDGMKNGRV